MKNTIPALIIIFLVLAGAGLLLYKAKQGIEGFTAIFPGLAEELAPERTILQATLNVAPGKVFQLTPGPEGYKLEEKVGYSLVERLALDNVDLQPNDVVSWHGWDWHIDDNDQRMIEFALPSTIDFYEGTLATRAKWVEADADEKVNTFFVNFIASDGSLFNIKRGWGPHGFEAAISNGTVEYNTDRIFTSDNSWHNVLAKFDGASLTLTVDDAATSTTIPSDFGGALNIYKVVVCSTDSSVKRAYKESYVIAWTTVVNYDFSNIVTTKPVLITDPTWFNGTHYLDLVNGIAATTYNEILRIPAEQPFLWHIKNLKSDNKLHLMWFPAGSIVRVIDANGFVREWTVSGNATVEGQVEDFAVSVDFDVLPNASIEAIVPSLKARFYVPQGFTVKLEAADGTAYSAVSSGYADIAVPEGEYTVKIIASSIETKDYTIEWSRSGSSLEIKVYDQGFPVTHALVIVKDPVANEVLAYGETDASGSVEFSEINAAAVEVEVHKLQDGIYYHDSETIQLTTQITASPSPMSTTAADNRRALYIAVGVFVIALIAVIVAIARRR